MPHSLGRLVGIVSSSVAVEYRQDDFGEANDVEVVKASTAPNSEATKNSVELLILILYWEGIVARCFVTNFADCRNGVFGFPSTYCVRWVKTKKDQIFWCFSSGRLLKSICERKRSGIFCLTRVFHNGGGKRIRDTPLFENTRNPQLKILSRDFR